MVGGADGLVVHRPALPFRQWRWAMSNISLETLVFDPDLVRLARRAFDLAWPLYDAGYPPESSEREAARDALGAAIIYAIQSGERDIARVRQLGLAGLTRFRNRAPKSSGLSPVLPPELRHRKIDPRGAT
jgi:hypothetical protein